MFKKFFEFIINHAKFIQNICNFLIDDSIKAIFFATLGLFANKYLYKFSKYALSTIMK